MKKLKTTFLLVFLIFFLFLGVLLVERGRRAKDKKESGFGKIDPYAGWQVFEADYGLGWGKVRINYPPDWKRVERAWRGEVFFLGFSPEPGDVHYLKEPMVGFLVEENPSLKGACDFEDDLLQGGKTKAKEESEFSGRMICQKEVEKGGITMVVTLMPYGKKMVRFVFEKTARGRDNSVFWDDYLKITRSFVLE